MRFFFLQLFDISIKNAFTKATIDGSSERGEGEKMETQGDTIIFEQYGKIEIGF